MDKLKSNREIARSSLNAAINNMDYCQETNAERVMKILEILKSDETGDLKKMLLEVLLADKEKTDGLKAKSNIANPHSEVIDEEDDEFKNAKGFDLKLQKKEATLFSDFSDRDEESSKAKNKRNRRSRSTEGLRMSGEIHSRSIEAPSRARSADRLSKSERSTETGVGSARSADRLNKSERSPGTGEDVADDPVNRARQRKQLESRLEAIRNTKAAIAAKASKPVGADTRRRRSSSAEKLKRSNSTEKEKLKRSNSTERGPPNAQLIRSQSVRVRSRSAEKLGGLGSSSVHGGRRNSRSTHTRLNNMRSGAGLSVSVHGTSSDKLHSQRPARTPIEAEIDEECGTNHSEEERKTGSMRTRSLQPGDNNDLKVSSLHNPLRTYTEESAADSADFMQFRPDGPKRRSSADGLEKLIDDLRASTHVKKTMVEEFPQKTEKKDKGFGKFFTKLTMNKKKSQGVDRETPEDISDSDYDDSFRCD